ncbi:MAG: hypothetical protein ABI378_15055 [Chitinophagaceae bacterium]
MKTKKRKHTLESEDLKGPVKQVRRLTYEVVKREQDYVPSVLSKHKFQNHLKNFDEQGMLTEELQFTIDGLGSRTTYNSADGRKKHQFYDDDNCIYQTSTHQNFYDEDGKIIQAVNETLSKGIVTKSISDWKYNEQRLTSEFISTTNGVVDSHRVFSYDDAGNQIVQYAYNKAGELEWKIENTYNEAGRC